MLANSQNFIFQKLNGFFPSQDDALALTHYHKALREASKMMKAPHMHNSDEAIAAIVSFICHQVSPGLYLDKSILTHLRHCLAASEVESGPSTEMLYRKSLPFAVVMMRSSQNISV
jgi:hypothetical protein